MSTATKVMQTIKDAAKKQTAPYDTTAEVVRIEGTTAWVHIPGGVSETPVTMSIDCKVGDTVHVRVSGGRAWVTGNSTAPPTDDTTAQEARTVADTAKTAIDKQQEHFWYDSEGAHVESAASGYRTDIRSDGMHIVKTAEEVARFAADSMTLTMESDGTRQDIFEVLAGGDSSRYTNGMTLFKNINSTAQTVTLGIDSYTSFIILEVWDGDSFTGPGVLHVGITYTNWTFSAGSSTVTYSYDGNQTLTISASPTIPLGFAAYATTQTNPTYTLGTQGSGVRGEFSATIGKGLKAAGPYQTTLGRYNDGSYKALCIGNGLDDNNRSDAFSVDWLGNVNASGGLSLFSGTALADCFERQNTTASIGSISAGGTKWLTIDVTKSGYKALGVVGWYVYSGLELSLYYLGFSADNTVSAAIYNTGSGASSADATLTVHVLYIKTS